MVNERTFLVRMDERAMRAPVDGSVTCPRPTSKPTRELYRGIKSDYEPAVAVTTPQTGVGAHRDWALFKTKPKRHRRSGRRSQSSTSRSFLTDITVDAASVWQRGQDRFNIYCCSLSRLCRQRRWPGQPTGTLPWPAPAKAHVDDQRNRLHDATVSERSS